MTGASNYSLALFVIRHCNGTLQHGGFSKTESFIHPVFLELPEDAPCPALTTGHFQPCMGGLNYRCFCDLPCIAAIMSIFISLPSSPELLSELFSNCLNDRYFHSFSCIPQEMGSFTASSEPTFILCTANDWREK